MTKKPLFMLALKLVAAFPALAGQIVFEPSAAHFSQEQFESSKNQAGTDRQCLLTKPFLQLPSKSGVHVVWLTTFNAQDHFVCYGDGLNRRAQATTTQLTRIKSPQTPSGIIYRHEATLDSLVSHQRTPYQVHSGAITSEVYHCFPLPPKGKPLKILFTSDHQNKPMVPANIELVSKTVGSVDAIFYAGDLADTADSYSLWFSPTERGFFPCLQGTATAYINEHLYRGGPLMQNSHFFSAAGNHEIMGSDDSNSPRPRSVAQQLLSLCNDPETTSVEALSFNQISYDEIFSLPKNDRENSLYYAVAYGDIYLIVLHATRVWRPPYANKHNGAYNEAAHNLADWSKWGWGEFIYEPIDKGSAQYRWLEKTLQSDACRQAKYKIVLLHEPIHTLGENRVPPFTHPIQTIQRNQAGVITAVNYSYPPKDNYLIRDLKPLLENHGISLVCCGHSHLWCRFESPLGTHFLETSNVGNSHGAYLNQSELPAPPSNPSNSSKVNDFEQLQPVVPTLAPLLDTNGNPLPYIASNQLTVFSVLDTASGQMDSFYFDPKNPANGVTKFDSFTLNRQK
ncbi:MAG: metallophosphoesterase [Chlamydiota bacterium]